MQFFIACMYIWAQKSYESERVEMSDGDSLQQMPL